MHGLAQNHKRADGERDAVYDAKTEAGGENLQIVDKFVWAIRNLAKLAWKHWNTAPFISIAHGAWQKYCS